MLAFRGKATSRTVKAGYNNVSSSVAGLVSKFIVGEIALGYGVSECIDILSTSVADFISFSGLGVFLLLAFGLRFLVTGLCAVIYADSLWQPTSESSFEADESHAMPESQHKRQRKLKERRRQRQYHRAFLEKIRRLWRHIRKKTRATAALNSSKHRHAKKATKSGARSVGKGKILRAKTRAYGVAKKRGRKVGIQAIVAKTLGKSKSAKLMAGKLHSYSSLFNQKNKKTLALRTKTLEAFAKDEAKTNEKRLSKQKKGKVWHSKKHQQDKQDSSGMKKSEEAKSESPASSPNPSAGVGLPSAIG